MDCQFGNGAAVAARPNLTQIVRCGHRYHIGHEDGLADGLHPSASQADCGMVSKIEDLVRSQ